MIRQLQHLISLLLFSLLLWACGGEPETAPDETRYRQWRHYLGDPGRSHFSTLSEFSPQNVHRLAVAWEYESPDFGQMQMSPIVVDSVLYGVSAALRAFALDARTGEPLWLFGDSLKATGDPSTALYIFLVFYLSCAVVNWAFYARKGSMLHAAAPATQPAE